MGQGFKEVASLRGDEKKFAENFSKINWSSVKKMKDCEACKGSGESEKVDENYPMGDIFKECEECDGEGEVEDV